MAWCPPTHTHKELATGVAGEVVVLTSEWEMESVTRPSGASIGSAMYAHRSPMCPVCRHVYFKWMDAGVYVCVTACCNKPLLAQAGFGRGGVKDKEKRSRGWGCESLTPPFQLLVLFAALWTDSHLLCRLSL